jgi:hypothetical protein
MTSIETAITSILDLFPNLRKKAIRKIATIAIICLAHFLVGILFTIQSGTYWIGK